MLSEEEKSAIEILKNERANLYVLKQTKFITCTVEQAEAKSEAIETVLSMLKEKDKEIESLEKTLDEKYIFVTGARTLYARLMSLDKENIVKDDLKLRNEIYQHIEDKEKKDKQIDLMAEYIANRDNDEDICKYNIGLNNTSRNNNWRSFWRMV